MSIFTYTSNYPTIKRLYPNHTLVKISSVWGLGTGWDIRDESFNNEDEFNAIVIDLFNAKTFTLVSLEFRDRHNHLFNSDFGIRELYNDVMESISKKEYYANMTEG